MSDTVRLSTARDDAQDTWLARRFNAVLGSGMAAVFALMFVYAAPPHPLWALLGGGGVALGTLLTAFWPVSTRRMAFRTSHQALDLLLLAAIGGYSTRLLLNLL